MHDQSAGAQVGVRAADVDQSPGESRLDLLTGERLYFPLSLQAGCPISSGADLNIH